MEMAINQVFAGNKRHIPHLRSRWGAAVSLAALTMITGPLVGSVAASTATSKAKVPLTVDVFAPFSGAEAAYGNFANLPGVKVGVAEINAAGGVLGHQINILTTDNLGDPADAIPIARQLLATHSNLFGIYGNPGNAALSVIPIFNAARIVEVSVSGSTSLDAARIRYFYRTFPPDVSSSAATAANALYGGHRRLAVVGLAGPDSQSAQAPIIAGFRRGGGKVVFQTFLQTGLTSYTSVLQNILGSKPDVIVLSGLDDSTSATFLTEMRQLNGLRIPLVLTSIEPDLEQAMTTALNLSDAQLGQYMTYVLPAVTSGASYNYFWSEFTKLYPGKSAPFNGYNAAMYDAVIITALAAVEAGSTNPRVFNKDMTTITADTRGAVQVHNYLQGVRALRAHKTINFVGASGQEIFNKYHWVGGSWEIVRPGANGGFVKVKLITAAQMAKL